MTISRTEGDPAAAIPDYQSLMLPVLRAAEGGEIRIGAVVQRLADDLGLGEAPRAVLLQYDRQTLLANRVHWAKTYLAKAGLVENTRRGHFRITRRRNEVLAARPERIGNRFLSRFQEFRQFTARAAPSPEEEPSLGLIAAVHSRCGENIGSSLFFSRRRPR